MNKYIDLSKVISETSNDNQPYVIVGGGISGIYAALLLQDLCPQKKIILIEQTSNLGGLLASKQFQGHWFDYGTHVPRQTGNAHIDELLFDDLENNGFSTFRNSNAANISKDNYLYTRSPNPYLATPQNENIRLQLDEIKASSLSEQPSDLETQLQQLYGRSLTNDFFRPCMQKRFATDLKELAPDSHKLIGLGRLILGGAKLMEELKQSPAYDRVLAFADQTVGMSELTHYYPNHGEGVGKWVDGLVEKLNSANVSIYCNARVSDVTVNDSYISHVSFIDENGQETNIACEQLIWCGPVFPLLKLSKSDYTPSYRPMIRQTYLYHFAFEDAPLIESNYVNINDPSYSSFRVTLYSNLCKTPSDMHRVTVEVIADGHSTIKEQARIPSADEIHCELVRMQLIDKNNSLKFSEIDKVAAGFPVITKQFMQEVVSQSDAASNHMQNLTLLGKANGKSFFMHDILVNTHEQICALVN